MSLLENIKGPDDVKQLKPEQLPELAKEIREEIISVTSKNGGHVGPNLGVVELSIALHRVFNTPKDKIIFDVSHQCYTHKLLTGRNGDKFKNIRKTGGLAGFCNIFESDHDAFGAGHAGTAISAALGLAAARDKQGGNENVVAVVGDGVMTCGITFEALNNVSTTTKRLIIVLNDNEMSIAKNVGAIASYLNELITNPLYNRVHKNTESFLKKVPGSEVLKKFAYKAMREAKDFFIPSSMFENLGLRYLGPIDGHNIAQLEQYLNFCKISDEPILLHIITKKGMGLECAMKNPEKFHGASPYDRFTGEGTEFSNPDIPTYQDAMGKTLLKIAQKDKKVVGITAAMPSGTGLSHLRKNLPEQFYDVGIAEEHAAIFAAGLARGGLKPVAAIYSSFMQRAFDCAMHDVCLQKLPVVFCMDRAGLSPQDGATHHGIFDIAFLRCLPNAVLMSPSNEDELADMLYTAIESGKPCFLRYPRGKAEGIKMKNTPEKIEIGKAVPVKGEASCDIAIWAIGNMVKEAVAVANALEKEKSVKVGVVNARFSKPIDEALLAQYAENTKLIVTMEDHSAEGGFGSAVLETLEQKNILKPVEIIGWPDRFVPHGSNVADIRKSQGLDNESIKNRIFARFEKTKKKWLFF